MENKSEMRCLGLGLIVLFILYCPIVLLGRGFLTIIHDEFDSDFVAYVLQTRHIFDRNIPELFNGTPKTSITMPANLIMLFYTILSPETALFVNYMCVLVLAYIGMFYICRELFGNSWIGCITGILFAMLPMYSVYGLSVMGQPILAYCFLHLWKQKQHRWLAFIGILFFGLASSLILVGFADIALLFIVGFWGIVKGKNVKSYVMGWFELAAVYVITNIRLIASIFAPESGFVTHKIEYQVTAMSFRSAFRELFFEGAYHAASLHKPIVYIAVIILVVAWAEYKKLGTEARKRIVQMSLLYILAVLIAGFYAFWHCSAVVEKRNEIGGLINQFQIDRFYWLYPCIWYILFAYSIYLGWLILNKRGIIRYMFVVLCTVLALFHVWKGSSLKYNWERLLNSGKQYPNYASVEEFFQPDLFAQIARYIDKPQESYRVLSVGLYPSIALYNGFYCLDGYSNNYNLDFKHQFRKIISEELEKNLALKKYFDDWGNRCYAFSNEIPQQYYISKKKNIEIHSLEFDFDQARRMGCEYILSSVTIENENLTKEKEFDSENSFYKVILYRIVKDDES